MQLDLPLAMLRWVDGESPVWPLPSAAPAWLHWRHSSKGPSSCPHSWAGFQPELWALASLTQASGRMCWHATCIPRYHALHEVQAPFKPGKRASQPEVEGERPFRNGEGKEMIMKSPDFKVHVAADPTSILCPQLTVCLHIPKQAACQSLQR